MTVYRLKIVWLLKIVHWWLCSFSLPQVPALLASRDNLDYFKPVAWPKQAICEF